MHLELIKQLNRITRGLSDASYKPIIYERDRTWQSFSIGCLVPAIAQANSQSIKQPILISRLLPKTTVFDCGGAAITLTRQPTNHDRFTYEAVTPRGQTLTIPNGVGYGNTKLN